MSSNNDNQEHNPVANLNMQPAKGILKSTKNIDDAGQDINHESLNNCPSTGMTRSESKSHKIPHFDEMNIIATYHPVDKDYGHMKIEEPKTPYAPNDIIDEEVDTEVATTGINPDTLAQRLNESTKSLSKSSHLRSDQLARRSIDEGIEPSSDDLEHRAQFENHRKQHYNEFEVVRLRRKEIEDELRALDQEEQKESSASDGGERKGNETVSSSRSSIDSIKPILVHHHSRDSASPSHHNHHVHVDDDHIDEQTLTPEELERKRQFELKRKQHYNEFRAARMADKDDDDDQPKKTE